MVHDYNTRGKKQELVVKMDKDLKMKDMENYTLISINFLKDEILNRKEIVTKNLQNENEKRRQKFEQLERRCAKYESDNSSNSTKILSGENVISVIESIAYNCRKLKRNELIHSCFSRGGYHQDQTGGKSKTCQDFLHGETSPAFL